MSVISPEILFTILGATGGGAVGAIIQALLAQHKNKAEALHLEAQADSVIVNAALQVADRLQVQLAELEQQTAALTIKNKEVRDDLDAVHILNQKMTKQIAKLEKENRSLKTSYTKLKEENEKLKAKLDTYNKDSK